MLMRKKGFRKIESPEKMPVVTSGIEMTHGEGRATEERLTGGNAPADESLSAKIVTDYIRQATAND